MSLRRPDRSAWAELIGPFPANESGPAIVAALLARPAFGFVDESAAEAAYVAAHVRNMIRRANGRGASLSVHGAGMSAPSQRRPRESRDRPQGEPCPIRGCTAHAKPRQLMCWAHWRRVPRALNRAVFDTYANIRNDVDAYRQARDAAIDAVNARKPGEC